MKYTLNKTDFLALLANQGYELEKYQAQGVFDKISGLYHANDSETVDYNGVVAWTINGHVKVKIDVTVTVKAWENLHAADEEPEEFFHELVEVRSRQVG